MLAGRTVRRRRFFFDAEAIEGIVTEGGSGDGFDEEVGHFFGGIAVDFAIDADDGAEGGDGIGDERLAVGFKLIVAGGDAAGIGVLDDGDGGLIEFLRQDPSRRRDRRGCCS